MSEHALNSQARSSRGAQRMRSTNRALFACINCKEKKLKCDNRAAGCENCRRADLMCLVEDPVTRRHRPRNYLETLERRVAFLESALKVHRPDLITDHFYHDHPQSASHAAAPPVVAETPQDDIHGSPSTSSKLDNDAREHSGLDELASKVGLLSLNAAGAEPYYLGSSSTFAFSRLISSSLRQVVLDSPKYGSLSNQPSENSNLPVPCPLPDYDVAVRLSTAYFQNINAQYPFLHEPTFRAWETTILSGIEGLETIDSGPFIFFFLNLVYAIGAILLPDLGYSSERLYMSAQMYIDHVLQHNNLASIQAILGCAVYSLRSSVGTSHWKLAGLALRQCIDLGYHRNSQGFRSTTNPLQVELRKRVFWSAYSMESQAAVMLGRPQGLPYHEVDAEYPMDIDDSCITEYAICGEPRKNLTDPPTNITAANHTFRIRRILSHIHTSVYSKGISCCADNCTRHPDIQHFRNEIEEWRAATPATMHYGSEALSLFATSEWFDAEYYYTLLQLYRVQIVDPEAGAADGVFIDCLRAAENICHAYRRQYLVGKSVSQTWTALHELFLAGLTFLHCLWTCPAARQVYSKGQVRSTCTDCIIVLVIFAERWETAAPYRDIFETLSNRTMVMMDDNEGQRQVANASAENEMNNQEDVTQWFTVLADAGMSEGFNELFASLVSDPSYSRVAS